MIFRVFCTVYSYTLTCNFFGVLMMELMTAEVQVLVHLHIFEVFFVELKAEGDETKCIFLNALQSEAKPTGLTNDRRSIYCI